MPFILFSCPVALSTTPSTMLNKTVRSEHLCLVPILREKAFSLSQLSMMLVVNLCFSLLANIKE